MTKKRKTFVEEINAAASNDEDMVSDGCDSEEKKINENTRPKNCCKDGCKTIVTTDNPKYCQNGACLDGAVCMGTCRKVIDEKLMRSVNYVSYCNRVGVFYRGKLACCYVLCSTCEVQQDELETGKSQRRRTRSRA